MEKLIYAIVLTGNHPEKLNLVLTGKQGITDKCLGVVPYSQISAVTGDINRNELVNNKKLVIEYAGVIEMLADKFTLLPMRFGSIVESDERIQKMLERNHDDFLQNLLKVENKFEFGLKVFCNPEKVRAEIIVKTNISQQTRASNTPETKNTVFRDYVNKKLEEHRVEEAVLHFVDSVITEIIQYINSLNPVHKFKKMVSPTLIIDAVFLLEKQNKEGLVQAIEDFQKRYPSLNFMLSGPWPPYSFVEINTK